MDNRQSQPVKFDEERFFFSDSTLLDIFSFKFLQGNPRTALKDKFTVVITDEMAAKYFGKTSPLGKTLLYEGQHPLRVTGVVEKFPDNSHIHIDLLSNYETMFATESENARQNLPRNWVHFPRLHLRPAAPRNLAGVGQCPVSEVSADTRRQAVCQRYCVCAGPDAGFPPAFAGAGRSGSSRQHDLHLRFSRHCRHHPADCLHQFCKPLDGPLPQAGERSRYSEGSGQ